MAHPVHQLDEASKRTEGPRRPAPGRHRISRRTTTITGGVAAVVIAGVVTATTIGGVIGGSSRAGANENDWQRLKTCESGNNYQTNTGNGYYGAYQFDLGTWRSVGGSGLPSNASAHEQDLRARALYRSRGWAPWECAGILGLKADPSNGYLPTAPTIAAPASAPGGSTVALHGSATPNARVVVYAHQVGLWKSYHPIATVTANASGAWAHNMRLDHTTGYYATASGHKSATATTRYLYRTNIYGAATAKVNSAYTIMGTARPSGAVQLYFRRAGGQSFVAGPKVHADARGHYALHWRARTDYQYFARSDTQSPTGTTKIATTARGPASVARSAAASPTDVVSKATDAVTKAVSGRAALSGTARPGAQVHVFVRHPGQQAWRTAATVRANRSGAWSTSLQAASSFTYFARSSTQQQSPAYSVAVR